MEIITEIATAFKPNSIMHCMLLTNGILFILDRGNKFSVHYEPYRGYDGLALTLLENNTWEKVGDISNTEPFDPAKIYNSYEEAAADFEIWPDFPEGW